MSLIRESYWRLVQHYKTQRGKWHDSFKPLLYRRHLHGKHGCLAVGIDARVGFFAQMTWCLMIVAHCEQHGLRPYLKLSAHLYADYLGENWLERFFDNLQLAEADRQLIADGAIPVCHISELEQLGLSPRYEAQMDIPSAHDLFSRYFRINPAIRNYVNAFVQGYFANRRVLGVHYRGTDKIAEATPVSWDYCAETVANFLSANPETEMLFVASDEDAFVAYMTQQFNSIKVISHEDRHRSQDGRSVHVRPFEGSSHAKGWEALVNCLLLARCHALIRTSSFLSAWASIFNPNLPVTMLNRPYQDKLWFPDRELAKISRNEYLPTGNKQFSQQDQARRR